MAAASPKKRLVEFLQSAFATDDLERFVVLTLELSRLAATLDFNQPLAEAAYRVVDGLDRRGLLDGEQVFAALEEERPARRAEIRELRRAFVRRQVPSRSPVELGPAVEVILAYGRLSRAHRRAVRSELHLETPGPIFEWGLAKDVKDATNSDASVATRVKRPRVWATLVERFSGALTEVHRLLQFVHGHRLLLVARVERNDCELEWDSHAVASETIALADADEQDVVLEVGLRTRPGDRVQLSLCAVTSPAADIPFSTLGALQAAGGHVLDHAGFGRS